MKHLRKLLFAAVVGAAALSGCKAPVVGAEINAENVKLIDPGRSTKDNVQQWFGAPLRKTKGPAGEIWVYRYLNPETKACQELVVSFSEDDSVCVFSSEGV